MPSWLKPEILVTALIGAAGMGGTVLLNWSNSNVDRAMSGRDVAELKVSMSKIEAAVNSVPLQALRLDILEKFKQDQSGQNGAFDDRLRQLAGDVRANTSDIANMSAASKVKLR